MQEVLFKNLNAHFLRLLAVNLLFLILVQLFGIKLRTNSNIVTILLPLNLTLIFFFFFLKNSLKNSNTPFKAISNLKY